MKPLAFSLLADENIHPVVISKLQEGGYEISALPQDKIGSSDQEVLELAYQAGRVILTHDSDFGWLAVVQSHPMIGIIYLRPGHIDASYTLDTLQALSNKDIDVHAPFIIVAERTGDIVNIRVRQL